MNPQELKILLDNLYQKKTTPAKVLEKLKTLPYENLDFARLDHHRDLRSGIPEVIYSKGKSPKQVQTIIASMAKAGQTILATRLAPEVYKKIKPKLPANAEYNETAQTLLIRKRKKNKAVGSVVVVTAGTSDIPIAEEAVITAEAFGSRVIKIYDIGVAGIHRLLDNLDALRQGRVVVAVAGMDGALPSVIGGLVDKPVIAVPTSVGYGASFNGLSALLTMLNSCATGIGTVNIDNGFGAGCLAHKINMLGEPSETE
jgi:NCAIR mutase (PurE)-related protein